MAHLLVLTLCALGCTSFVGDRAAADPPRGATSRQAAPPRDLRSSQLMRANAQCQHAVTVFDDWEDATLRGRRDEADRLAERLTSLLASCTAGQRALLPAAWRDARTTAEVTALLPSLTREQVEPALWLATAGVVQLAIDPLKHIAQLPVLRAQLARCAELAPGFRDAEAEVLLGTLQAGQSSFAGGSDGSEYFARARQLAGPGVLNVEVMFARGVAVARKDRALFTSTLERVLAADLERWPEQRLANEAAREKARRYLAAADTLVPN